MITVQEAEQHILATQMSFGKETLALGKSLGRILAQDVHADRDFPAYDRVAMDGIVIKFADWEAGTREFEVAGMQLAGSPQLTLEQAGTCFEIMTGAMCSVGGDTIVPYEEIEEYEKEGKKFAKITSESLSLRQNIHGQAADRKRGDLLIPKGTKLSPVEIAIAATAGIPELELFKSPTVAIISTGDELVAVDQTPLPYQIRHSNNYALEAALEEMGIQGTSFHLLDDKEELTKKMSEIVENFDVMILTGGVSRGKADFVPEVLDEIGVKKHFHKVRQRPGKPFWFGEIKDTCMVFALPGNPVSSFVNFTRYAKPWFQQQLGMSEANPSFAILAEDFHFKPDLTYFLQVKLSSTEDGKLMAHPYEGGGSGDHANMLYCDAFMELPRGRNDFVQGEVFPIFPYKNIL